MYLGSGQVAGVSMALATATYATGTAGVAIGSAVLATLGAALWWRHHRRGMRQATKGVAP